MMSLYLGERKQILKPDFNEATYFYDKAYETILMNLCLLDTQNHKIKLKLCL